MSGVRIRIEHGQDAGKTYRFGQPGVYVLGRAATAAVRLLDMKVSKGHCHIRVGNENGPVLTDLKSTHGTLLNGNPVKDALPLHPGDEIRVGMTILRVLSDGPADAEAAPSDESAVSLTEGGDLAATAAIRRDGPPPPRKTLPPDELVGKELGGYKVLEKIGQGGMGAVYIAEQKSLNRKVALKVLSERLVKDAAFVDQFVNEARAAGQLNHPNVVQVYDVGQEGGRYFFSMEYVLGGSLEDRLRTKGPAEWQEALPWFLDAANAFIFAQKRGILHRDVKPDNLMVAEDGSAKLCDLGLAKKSESQDLLQQGIIGTPHFISPEAIRRKKEIDGRSDLYSLGCAFYRLLTGENPYGGTGKSVKDILMSHLKDPVPRVSAKNPDVPRDLDEVVYRLMQKEPEGRYANAEELWHALDRLRIQYGLEAHGLRTGSRKTVVIALVAVVIALGVAGYFMLKPERTIRGPKTAEDIAREQQQQADAAAAKSATFKLFVADRKAAFLEIQNREIAKNIKETWRDPAWEAIAGDYRAFAKDLEENAEYGARDEVKQLAQQARDAAQAIDEHRAMRRSVEKVVDQAAAGATQELEQVLREHKVGFLKALDEQRWLAAEEMTTKEGLEKVLVLFRERRIGPVLPPDIPKATREGLQDERLLGEDAIAEVVKRVLGEPPMKDWPHEIDQRARRAHAERLRAMDEAAKPRTPEAMIAAIELADAYLGDLPPHDPKPVEGTVGFLLQGFRQEVTKRKSLWEDAAAEGLRKAFEADRGAYFELLIALRRPGQGLFPKLRLIEAIGVAGRKAETMKRQEYKDAALERAEDAKAAKALLDHLAESFKKGAWSGQLILQGETKPAKLKDVSSEGFLLADGKELQTWAQYGLPWVVASVFYADDKTPRFPFTLDDHRGLAVLAEAAGNLDLARRHFELYLKDLSADATRAQEHTRRRLAKYDDEKTAAGVWILASAIASEVKEFLDRHDPAVIGEEAFTDEIRAELADPKKKGELAQRITEAQTLLHRLETEESLATTVWGTVLRTAPHPAMRFVPSEPEPRKPAEPEKPAAPGNGAAAPANGGGAGTDGAEKKEEPQPAVPGGDGSEKPGDAAGNKPEPKDGPPK